jgi:hypothetical protein
MDKAGSDDLLGQLEALSSRDGDVLRAYDVLLLDAVLKAPAMRPRVAAVRDLLDMAAGRPQTYGTQVTRQPDGKERLHALWAPQSVQPRRAAMGLKWLDLAGRETSTALLASDQALRAEIFARARADQAVRHRVIAKMKAGKGFDRKALDAVDAVNLPWLKAVVAAHGWPTYALVGADAAHDFWLLVQHGDRDLAFQTRCLSLMEAALQQGQANGLNFAYLTDRVLTGHGKLQRYGTQFMQEPDGSWKVQPLEDPDQVDERRKAVGLDTLEEYTRQMNGLD